MDEIIVPIDLTQEEKEILAIFSKRQFLIIFPPGVISLAFLLFGNIPFIPTALDVILRIIIFIVVVTVCLCLSFVYLDKHQQYLSEYVITKYKFWRGQKTYTR